MQLNVRFQHQTGCWKLARRGCSRILTWRPSRQVALVRVRVPTPPPPGPPPGPSLEGAWRRVAEDATRFLPRETARFRGLRGWPGFGWRTRQGIRAHTAGGCARTRRRDARGEQYEARSSYARSTRRRRTARRWMRAREHATWHPAAGRWRTAGRGGGSDDGADAAVERAAGRGSAGRGSAGRGSAGRGEAPGQRGWMRAGVSEGEGVRERRERKRDGGRGREGSRAGVRLRGRCSTRDCKSC